ncbi:unnamed protein product [Rhodiola kirilowii]
MNKGKVKMDPIEDVFERRTTYKKRRNTLMRKMNEITTLCGVEAGMIVFSEFEEGKGGVQTWPENREAVQVMVERCKAESEANVGKGRENDMNGFVKGRIEKERMRLGKLQMGNEEKEVRMRLSECFDGKSVRGLGERELRGLDCVIDEKLRLLGRRMRDLRIGENVGHVDEEGVLEGSNVVTDPGSYFNFDYPLGSDYGSHGMNMMGAELNVAPNWSGEQDQAGPSGANGQAENSSWGRRR